jgi:hypothetical protein
MNFASLVVRAALDNNGIDRDNIDTSSTNATYIAMARKYCKVGECPVEWATIQYRPTMAGNIVYLLFFLALLGGQLFYGIRNKTWSYMGAVSTGVLLEIIGYIGRLMLHQNPFIMNNFLVYVLLQDKSFLHTNQLPATSSLSPLLLLSSPLVSTSALAA